MELIETGKGMFIAALRATNQAGFGIIFWFFFSNEVNILVSVDFSFIPCGEHGNRRHV
jgi:hypothetical protein